MSPKSLVLVATAVAVMAMGVYLFIQVRSTPAQAQVSATPAPPPPPTPATPPTRIADSTAPPPTHGPAAPTPRPEGRPSLGNGVGEPQAMTTLPVDDQRANPKMDSMMELANKAYDQQDFDQAIAIAGKVLSKDPSNVRMLRIMVSANCIGGDSAVAQKYYEQLPKGVDRDQMKSRCDRYQVTLKD